MASTLSTRILLFEFWLAVGCFGVRRRLTHLVEAEATSGKAARSTINTGPNPENLHETSLEKTRDRNKEQERAYGGIQLSPAWRLDREMRRRLILQQT